MLNLVAVSKFGILKFYQVDPYANEGPYEFHNSKEFKSFRLGTHCWVALHVI
jgi:hypothetical protein